MTANDRQIATPDTEDDRIPPTLLIFTFRNHKAVKTLKGR